MDQERIGKFIAKIRKEKHLTQQDLALKLNVTDRAISNWENGRRIPDVSLLKPLSEYLDISVNELINGEKIKEENFKSSSNDTIVHTLESNLEIKVKSKKMICILFTILFFLLFIFLYFLKTIYPKIDIYNLVVSLNENTKVEKQFSYRNHYIYYYGITTLQLCNQKEYCFDIHNALSNHQTNLKSIQSFLDSQNELEHNKKSVLYDGGTTIYENDFYSAIFCNTLSGNKDIYFGTSDMVEKLNGAYCEHQENKEKTFIRTYHVVSVQEIDDEYFNVTLKQNDKIETIKLHKSNMMITAGRNYEFTFTVFHTIEDTIANLFESATILSIKETDKFEMEWINEPIYVNETFKDTTNEIEGISIKIKEGTLTKTSATIIIYDRNGTKYVYGKPFYIERLENGIWKKLDGVGYFNEPAYFVDRNGILVMTQEWSHIYGALKNGKYRLVKEIFLDNKRPITEIDKQYISVIFTIE